MINILIKAFWLFLPAGVANMAPVLFKVPILDKPINKKYFGSHKTCRGFAVGILSAILVVWLQKIFYAQTKQIALIDYSTVSVLLLGFLLGIGALLGDLVGSFFKRRVGVKPGKPWVPVDQIDYILGAVLLLSVYKLAPLTILLVGVPLFGVLSLLVNLIGYALKLKKSKI